MDRLHEWFDGGDAVTAGLTVLSLLVSGWLYFKQRRIDTANLSLQKRMAQIEIDRRSEEIARATEATLRASFVRRQDIQRGQRTSIVIENTGGAIADDVRVESLRSLVAPHGPVLMHDSSILVRIHPADRVALEIAIPVGSGPPFEIVLSWTDPRGRQTKTQMLTEDPSG